MFSKTGKFIKNKFEYRDMKIILILMVSLFLCSWFGLVSVNAQDVPTSTGTITVTTHPVRGEIYINDNYVGFGAHSKEYPVGDYTISFGHVAGYKTPDYIVINLKENETYPVTGYYELTGSISVTTEPVAGKIHIDGKYVGMGSYFGEYELGTYTLSFGAVAGYTTPDAQTVTVTSDRTTFVIGRYEPFPFPITGTISVTTEPVDGKVYIDSEYAGTGSFSGEYEPGTYRVSFGDVAGYVTPDAQIVVVNSGRSTTVRGRYELVAPAIAPIIQLYSTRTTVTSQQPGLLTISAVNIMGNPVMTAETVFTVDPGIEIMGVGTPFVSSGAGQYTGKFIVLPEEQKYYTVSVRALREDITSFTVKAQTIYYFGSDIANRQMIQNTITFGVVSPPPIFIPTPVSTKTENSSTTETENSSSEPSSPGFEAVFTVAGLLIIAYLIRNRRK